MGDSKRPGVETALPFPDNSCKRIGCLNSSARRCVLHMQEVQGEIWAGRWKNEQKVGVEAGGKSRDRETVRTIGVIWVKDEGSLDHMWGDNRRDDKSGLILNIF